MKRRFLAWLMIALCLSYTLPAAGAASFSAARAGIKYGGATYRVGQTATKWKSKLGKYTRKLNETNGTLSSYTYTYKKRGVRITTLYSSEVKKEKITSITIVGKSVTTAAGLKIGQGYKKMTGLYGKKFTRKGGVYTYKAGKRRLQIRAAKGKIKSIRIS